MHASDPVITEFDAASREAALTDARRLDAKDDEALSRLRCEVKADNPEPMGLVLEEELSRSLAGCRSQLSSSAVFGAFVDDEFVATAVVSPGSALSSGELKMVVSGVFRFPWQRSRGLACAVAEAAIRC